MRKDQYRPAEERTWSGRVLASLAAEEHRPAIASVTAGKVEIVTRRDLRRLTAGAIARLNEIGVPRGGLVPALLTQRPVSIALLLAGALTGRPLSPLSPRMTQHELTACLAEIPADVLVTESRSADLAHELGRNLAREVVVVDDVEPLDTSLPAPDNPDAVAFTMHTSGTTGLPKRVAVAEGALGHRADVNGYLLDLSAGDRLVATSLFHHVGGLGNIAVALATGATLIAFRDFTVDAWRSIEQLEPTHAVVVPSVIEMLLAHDALSLPTMRVVAYGGAPINPDTMRRLQEVMPEVEFVNLFGQTEGSPITFLSPEDHVQAATTRPELLSSVGKPAPGATVVIHAPDADGVGEVWVRAPHSFVVDEDGWQHTGDLGRFDDEFLFLSGRRGDKIIRGGENVYPIEVERVLNAHPAVREVAVVGIPDQRLGETVMAYVVPASPQATPDQQTLRSFARERLAGFKVPVRWEFVSDLPRNSSGKVLRQELAKRADAPIPD